MSVGSKCDASSPPACSPPRRARPHRVPHPPRHGFGYRAILAHYLTGTSLGTAVPNRTGTRPVSPHLVYYVARVGNARGIGWEQWPDTRSQVYRGIAGESPRATTAVRATARQVVTYAGRPVTTFFFSTSGAQTENVEDFFLGSPARPGLRSVDDPYDTASRLHRWTLSFSLPVAQSRLSGYVRGTLQAINVTRRGISPRVVSAQVVGSAGITTVSGPTLKYRLWLYDTWVYFTLTGSGRGRSSARSPCYLRC